MWWRSSDVSCVCSCSESTKRHIRTLTVKNMWVVCVRMVRVFPTKRCAIHLGAKPLECELCKLKYSHVECVKIRNAYSYARKTGTCMTWRFSQIGSLKVHLRTRSTGEKSFNCDFCVFNLSEGAIILGRPFKCECMVRWKCFHVVVLWIGIYAHTYLREAL